MRARCLVIGLAAAAGLCVSTLASAQSVKHIQPSTPGGIATAVWAGDTLYVSGQLASPQTAADRATNKPAVWGNTQAQAENAFSKIETILKEQGLTMGDVVMMRVYMVADPAMDNKLDFAGMNAAYNKFFGTPTQPNKPARTTVQVAALVNPGPLLEIEVQGARNK
jgi:enamine deaminase RidA (YjgF/YER057c/UK114 family)